MDLNRFPVSQGENFAPGEDHHRVLFLGNPGGLDDDERAMIRQVVRLCTLLLAYTEEHPQDEGLSGLINELALVVGAE